MHLHMVGWVFGPCWVPHTYLGSSTRSLLGGLHMVGVFSLAGVTNLLNCLLANTNTTRLAACEQQEETKAAPNYQLCFEFISKSTDKSLEIILVSK